MRSKQISVIIPTYNHSNFVIQAISSAERQSLKPIEIVVVNDGSPDNTDEILTAYQGITYIKQSNTGAHEAINRGVAMAKSDYIAILNDDDIYDDDYLQQAIHSIDMHNSEFHLTIPRIFGQGFMWDAYQRHMKTSQFYINKHGYLKALLKINWFISTSGIVMKKSHFEKINGFRDYKLVHDWDFVLRSVFEKRARFSVSNLSTWSYRVHESNSSLDIKKSIREVEETDILKPYEHLISRLI